MAERSTQEVFEDHLRHRGEKDLDADLHNYAEDVVILSSHGVFHGHDGVRESGELLRDHLPGGSYHYEEMLTHGDVAFLVWTAEADSARVDDGADSFLIRDGLIRVQTIHYRAIPADALEADLMANTLSRREPR